MKNIIKYITSKTVQPLVARYVSWQRVYQYKGITLQVPPTVFHPGLFFSTRLLLKFIEGIAVQGKTFLEPGAGSGLIAISAARRGALVTATDINSVAVEYLHKNSRLNNVGLRVIASDLFADIPKQRFDIIAINPPYYTKNPSNDAERAWYCGANSEYFYRLFEAMGDFVHENSLVYMILSDECDIMLIKSIAAKNGFCMLMAAGNRVMWEMNYIFTIKSIENLR